jgi:hypothetical protein
MRLRSSTAIVLVCVSLGWLGWVRQQAAGTDQKLAALRLEIASLNSAAAADAAREQSIRQTDASIMLPVELKPSAASTKPVQDHAEPLDRQPQARKSVPLTEGVAAEPGRAQVPEQRAAIWTGQRGECSSHPVVFWHYPKTGTWKTLVL